MAQLTDEQRSRMEGMRGMTEKELAAYILKQYKRGRLSAWEESLNPFRMFDV